jgi:hypothetical protein
MQAVANFLWEPQFRECPLVPFGERSAHELGSRNRGPLTALVTLLNGVCSRWSPAVSRNIDRSVFDCGPRLQLVAGSSQVRPESPIFACNGWCSLTAKSCSGERTTIENGR